MTLRDIKKYIDSLSEKELDSELVIDVNGSGYVDGTCAYIKSITTGFDWYQGKTLLVPEKQIRFNDDKCKHCGMASFDTRVRTKLRYDFDTKPFTHYYDVIVDGEVVKSIPTKTRGELSIDKKSENGIIEGKE